jgi:hypothetical protein
VSIEGAIHADLTIFDRYEIEIMRICYPSRALAARAFNREVSPACIYQLFQFRYAGAHLRVCLACLDFDFSTARDEGMTTSMLNSLSL